MVEVLLKYNPYKVESTIQIDGKPLGQDSHLVQYQNTRIQVWVDKLFPILMEELNEDSFLCVFQGTQFDYQDVLNACEQISSNKQVKIGLRHIPAMGSEDRLGQLKEIFTEMQEGPFEELKSESIKRNFDKAVSSNFEIAVIATMSSGKSTLINSMLSQELMPSMQKACTATIVSIKNVDGKETFSGSCYDIDGMQVEPEQEVTLTEMKRFNDNEKVVHIELEGDIPSISSRKMNLVLVDTPGPNNSRNASHRDRTYRVIKNETKPMVLYILNTTQLAINDDNNLLTAVAEQMKIGDKQSKDRFIFAVNKIDELDPEVDGSTEDTLAMVKEYLEEKGIKDPNIFPVSAEMAKVIRMEQNGHYLTPKQRRTLNNHDFFISEQDFQLVKYAPLSSTKKNYLESQIKEAEQNGDTLRHALLNTGIPSIEEAINEYLEKYALTTKITAAVQSFKDIVNGKELERKLRNELVENEEKRLELHEQMKKLKIELEGGQKAKELKERIDQKTYKQYDIFRDIEQKVEKKLLELTELFDSRTRLEKTDAEVIINQIQEEIKDIQSDIKTDIEKVIEATLLSDLDQLLEEYKSYVQDLIEDSGTGIEKEHFQLLLSDLPDTELIIDQLTYEEVVTVKDEGERSFFNPKRFLFGDSTKSYERSWYNPKRLFLGQKYRDEVTATKTFINIDDITESFIDPTRWNLLENIDSADRYLSEEEKKLKGYFQNELDRLEALLYVKVEEMEELSSSNDYIVQRLREDHEKYEWLQEFIINLDQILEV
jgi:GTPase Era involved in 16S rRNA processing